MNQSPLNADYFQTQTKPRIIRGFIYTVVVFCLSFGSCGFASQPMCSLLFPEHIRFLNVNDDNTQFYIDDMAVGYIKNSGRQNIYIFRAEEEKKQFIYKLAGLRPAQVSEILNGIQLGAAYGAPQLHEFGDIMQSSKIRDRGPVVYFKLEALFPYEKFLTIKENGLHSSDPKSFQILDEISDSFIRMAIDGVVASDPDVAYTADFKWRWIDADLWKKGPPDEVAYQIGEFARRLNNSEMAFYFSKEMTKKAKDVSAEFTNEMKKHLSYYLK